MDEKMFTFGDIEIEKNKFSSYKKSQFSEDADIDSVLISDKISTGERNYKYFIGYLYKIIKLNHYIKCFLYRARILTIMMRKLIGYIFWLKMVTY